MREDTRLLCETCGYDLTGLPHHGACPECGRSIASSLPASRAGSAWQQAPTARAYFVTGAGMLRRPRESFGDIQIEPFRSSGLTLLNAMLGAGAAALACFLVVVPRVGDRAGALAALAGGFVMGVVVLNALTGIEARGIRFWSRRHRFRITPDHATAICGHASYGWVVSGIGIALAIQVGHWDAAVRFFGRVEVLGSPRLGQVLTWPVYLFIAAFPGLLVFETLAYLGVRACKYANLPGSGTGRG